MKVDQIRFRYSANRSVVHTLELDADYSVVVLGDPDNAAYEWAVVKDGVVVDYSDVAYGMWSVALRDGLSAYLG